MSDKSHTCQETDCYFCTYTATERISQSIPLLPQEYMRDIRCAGGWYLYRDKAILENSRTFKGSDLKRLNERIRSHEKRNIRRKSA